MKMQGEDPGPPSVAMPRPGRSRARGEVGAQLCAGGGGNANQHPHLGVRQNRDHIMILS